MEISLIFCLGWPQTTVLLVFISPEAEITGVHHHTQPPEDFETQLLGFCFAKFEM
jgi:hypothetical protein